MRTLALWIAGIFGLGLAVGSFVAATTATTVSQASDPMGIEGARSVAPLVDCGAGREALVEQVIANGETVARVKCVATEPAPIVRATPAPVVTAERVPGASSDAPVAKPEAEEEEGSRSLKDSALIIGGAAGAGAGIGAIAKGKKGAAVGAAAGAVAGTVYDLATRKNKKK